MSGSRRCIFLAGAPDDNSLSWDESGLLADFEEPIQRFLGKKSLTTKSSLRASLSRLPARWRSVACDDLVSNSLMRQRGFRRDKATKLQPNSNAARHLEDHDFLEHSIAILEDLDVSQIVCTAVKDDHAIDADLQPTATSFASTSFTDISTITTDDSLYTTSLPLVDGVQAPPKIPGGIRDLKSLPKADYITRIHPQTETVNLLIGIINVSECRTVRLRRRNVDMDIVELTVGDDTMAGFCITFWLVPQTSQNQRPQDDLRGVLRLLRPGQVALIQNVALSAWRGNVYGQSLSRRFTRNSTTLCVIEAGSKSSLSTPVANKLQRVQDWVNDFVGVGDRRAIPLDGEHHATRKRKLEELPPDTQD